MSTVLCLDRQRAAASSEDVVVAKTATATEELVVHKDVKERTETVRDTVRETKVDVEQPDGTPKPSAGPDLERPAGRP
jgi:stress response protein YsnF